ncbi:hypothetical protein [Streptomyces sp. DSM 40750]|uniref:hypothetical protein n=1 Tax=Streptomyces sp. DSM 40750 TaxID=2801030 RepID=UPI00214AA931|nr:hypothetical protein [Streptomyces sp. DSM 40750]UUU23889.1 hypothetical protein JIX55_28545 [Streptomyces sp. DSM 40750]
MDEPDQRERRGRRPDRQSALGCGGCALSALGATAASIAWTSSSRTRRHLGGGFEGEGTDYTVLVTELPLVVATGAALPALACLLIALLLNRRRGGRGGNGPARQDR